MSTYSYIFFILCLCSSCTHEEKDMLEIHSVLNQQVESWNRGDIEGYMEGYWKSDLLIFTGSTKINRGWDQTLARYQKSYPSKADMGALQFNDLDVQLLSNESAFATGEWRLTRVADTLQGRFTLVWRKINNNWCIIADHSS